LYIGCVVTISVPDK